MNIMYFLLFLCSYVLLFPATYSSFGLLLELCSRYLHLTIYYIKVNTYIQWIIHYWIGSCGFLWSTHVCKEKINLRVFKKIGSGTRGLMNLTISFEQVPLVVITKYVHDKFRNSMVCFLVLLHFWCMLYYSTLEAINFC